jgi:hypothetical protein
MMMMTADLAIRCFLLTVDSHGVAGPLHEWSRSISRDEAWLP